MLLNPAVMLLLGAAHTLSNLIFPLDFEGTLSDEARG